MYWCIINYLLTLNSSITLSFRHNIININMISVIFLLQRIMCGPILSSLSQMNTSLAMFSMRMGANNPIWMLPKMVGFPPKSSHFNRGFHYFQHPFWGGFPYFWKHPISTMGGKQSKQPLNFSNPYSTFTGLRLYSALRWRWS